MASDGKNNLQMHFTNFEASATCFLSHFDEPALCASLAPELLQLVLGGQTQVAFRCALLQKVAAVLFSRGEASLKVSIHTLQPRDLGSIPFP